MNELFGRELGPYKLISLLGEGTSASVYLATQLTAFNRNVAVKVMRPDLIGQDDFAQRLELEARTIASLTHANIVRLIEYLTVDQYVCLVMDFIPGGNLSSKIKQENLSIEQIDRICEQIASGLDYAHGRSIVHRDLKPHNVLLDESGNAYLSDFGIAKLLIENTKLTRTGVTIGTPAYMSPEQWQGIALDHRSDVYSFAVMVYEMLTGSLPFKGDSTTSMMYKHLSEMPSPVETMRDELPSSLNAVLHKALAKTADQRYSSAGEFYRELRYALVEGSSRSPYSRPTVSRDRSALGAMPSKSPPVTPSAARRGQLAKIAIGAGLLIMLGIAAALLITPTIIAPSVTPTIPNEPSVTPPPSAPPPSAGAARTDSQNVSQVLVPAGCFEMGASIDDPNALEEELPPHEVCLDAFWMDVYEVTNADYERFVDADGYSQREWWSDAGWAWRVSNGFISPEQIAGSFNDPQQPRLNLSWYEAEAYAAWRGGRLPTEAEWEYAARGETGRTYVWGNGWTNGYARLNESSRGGSSYTNPANVGAFEGDVSWSGIFDLNGNVSEWVQDLFMPYPSNDSPQNDPEAEDSGERVIRGGSWRSSPTTARLVGRISSPPDQRRNSAGVRVVTPLSN